MAVYTDVKIDQVSATFAYIRLGITLTGNEFLYGTSITTDDFDNLNIDLSGDRLEVVTSYRSSGYIQQTSFTPYFSIPLGINAEFYIKNIVTLPVESYSTITIDRNYDTLTVDTPIIYMPGAVSYMQNLQLSGATSMPVTGNSNTYIYLYLRSFKNA